MEDEAKVWKNTKEKKEKEKREQTRKSKEEKNKTTVEQKKKHQNQETNKLQVITKRHKPSKFLKHQQPKHFLQIDQSRINPVTLGWFQMHDFKCMLGNHEEFSRYKAQSMWSSNKP